METTLTPWASGGTSLPSCVSGGTAGRPIISGIVGPYTSASMSATAWPCWASATSQVGRHRGLADAALAAGHRDGPRVRTRAEELMDQLVLVAQPPGKRVAFLRGHRPELDLHRATPCELRWSACSASVWIWFRSGQPAVVSTIVAPMRRVVGDDVAHHAELDDVLVEFGVLDLRTVPCRTSSWVTGDPPAGLPRLVLLPQSTVRQIPGRCQACSQNGFKETSLRRVRPWRARRRPRRPVSPETGDASGEPSRPPAEHGAASDRRTREPREPTARARLLARRVQRGTTRGPVARPSRLAGDRPTAQSPACRAARPGLAALFRTSPASHVLPTPVPGLVVFG